MLRGDVCYVVLLIIISNKLSVLLGASFGMVVTA